MNATIRVSPVAGAAEYFPGTEYNRHNQHVVFMKDNEGHVSVVDTAKNQDQARIKANKWQQKENRAVERFNRKK